MDPQDSWRLEAACKDMPTDWFWDTNGAPGRPFNDPRRRVRVSYPRARPVCASCTVRRECFDESVETELLTDLRDTGADIHGFRAGFTPLERYKLRSNMSRWNNWRDQQAVG